MNLFSPLLSVLVYFISLEATAVDVLSAFVLFSPPLLNVWLYFKALSNWLCC